MHHEMTCPCGEEILVGGQKGKKALCLRCFRKIAKNPPPLPLDILSNAPESTTEGLKIKSNKEGQK